MTIIKCIDDYSKANLTTHTSNKERRYKYMLCKFDLPKVDEHMHTT